MDTAQLVVRAQRGDEAAFAELVKAYQAQLYRIALSYVKNREDALDIVSESVYRAFVNLRSLKNPSHFKTWLIRIVINQAVNVMRQRQRVAVTGDLSVAPFIPHGLRSDDLLDLYAAIDKLDENQRAVIILKYCEDLTLTQVAQVLERPLGTIKTHLHGALKTLRLELKEEFQ
ncbi:MAG: sigma-70 family RNA polymerase sigma factor [Selenomonadales bacterium]|nr:sigma-70 family RNA polymerase sigma factor [Selenomonadales bacterium]